MASIWILTVLILWLLLTLYLVWKVMQCKCGKAKESFQNKKDGTKNKIKVDKKDNKEDKEETNADTEANEGSDIVDEDSLEKGSIIIGGKKVEEGYAEDKDMEEAEDTKKETKGGDKKETTKSNSKKSGSIKEQLLNYGEMKIFEGLRDNSYSIGDIKRMIREGEINEKMIEKFLARIESMENKNYKKKSLEKDDKIEGFAGGAGYASAVFN